MPQISRLGRIGRKSLRKISEIRGKFREASNKPMPLLQIKNVTRGILVATQGRAADTFFTRFKGLIGAPSLTKGEGLLILPCNSIHTHVMRFPIDVLYVSKDNTVVAVDRAMAPWRFGRIHRRARYVIELPAGAAAETQPGDRLAINGYPKLSDSIALSSP